MLYSAFAIIGLLAQIACDPEADFVATDVRRHAVT